MKIIYCIFLFSLISKVVFGQIGTNDGYPVFDHLVWSDEFDTDGSLDNNKWFHQTQLPSGGSWYNGEQQHYTERDENTYIKDGSLNLVAIKESFTDQGVTKNYTSARLNSKFAFTYGKIEVRAKLPSGIGTWPAIWTLGKNINERGAYWNNEGFSTTSWPACGEIDIMEHWGSNQNFVQSATHTPSSSGNTQNKGGQTIATASSEFHIYTLEWFTNKLIFSVDDKVHYTYQPSIFDNSTWPFDKEQYLLLNVAIQSSITSAFTQATMEVDYVRIYQEDSGSSSILNVENMQLSAFPNPVQDFLHFKTNAGIKSISVFDLSGRILLISTLNTKSIDLSSLNSGTYLVKVAIDNSVKTIKIMKK